MRRLVIIRRHIRKAAFECCLALVVALIPMLNSCYIEPPLRLPGEDVVIEVPMVLQELDVVWEIDVSWKAHWIYGWDDEDSALWGPITYPEPTNFEIRRYFLGAEPSVPHSEVDAFTIWEPRFQKKFNFGYYDILVWSNIDSEDHTQVLIINEKDLDNVIATTSTQSAKLYGPSSSSKLYNQPEIFYSAIEKDIHITNDPKDYDYYDEENNVWVMKLEATLQPLVYIYLVQVVLHNNKGRVTGVPEYCAITGLSRQVNVTTAQTGLADITVLFGMRLKKDLYKGSELVDVLGGKLTTFGLCGMDPWQSSRGASYKGSRADVDNDFAVSMRFANGADSTYYYNVTDQFQRQCHGGLITIDIDVDSLKIPTNTNPSGGGSGFDPKVEEYGDTIVHDIVM